jgi:prepilin-type N-terminal cleavage/methylation domain-containing protein
MRGFTLIELMLVMTMLLTVIAVAMPSLSNFFRGRTLDSETRRFLSLTRYGQSRAVSEGIPMVLWMDTKEGTYGLEQEQGYIDGGDPKAVSFKLNEDLSFELANVPAQSGQFRQAGSRDPFAQIGQSLQSRRNVPMIRFQPDGFIGETSPQSVWIREGDGDQGQDAIWITQSRNRLNYEIQTNVLQRANR